MDDRRPLTCYAIAALVTGVAIALRLALDPFLGPRVPYVTFFAAAAFSAAIGGLGPGVLSVAVAALAARSLFFPVAGVVGMEDLFGLALFVVLGLAIVVAIAAQLRARTHAAETTARAKESEARTRAIVESISDVFYALDAEWRFTYLNRRATEYFGRTTEELLGRTIWEVMPEKVGTVFERSFTNAMRDRTPAQFETLSPVTHRFVDVHVYPTESGLSVFSRDIADRLALRAGEERMAAILSSAGDAIITIDESERITVFSAGAEQIFGCSAVDAIGQSIERFIPARFRATHHGHITEFGETGVSMRQMGGERRLAAVRASGEEFPMEARISQSIVNGEKLYTVILRDVTERLRGEHERDQLLAEARAAAEDAERANRAKDEFLATVSHELRTPLTPILAWTTLLRTRTLDATTFEKGIATIERAARSQARLVDDLLDVSRIVAGKVRLEVRPVDLTTVIDTAIESLRSAADAKAIRLHATVDHNPGLVTGDPERLQQVAWNLLSNAIKFTPKGGSVDVVLQRIDSQVELVIRDTGAGIAPEFLPHVFERFRQHDSTTTRAHGGLGIGLAIVRHLVELHGGEVGCDSAGLGRGATFTVVLPIAHGRTAASAAAPAVAHPAAAGAADGSAARLDGRRVVVVDDEHDTLDVLVTVLRDAGADVRGVTSASAALDLVRTWRPDVLVSDVAMPDEDGYTLIARVRALGADQGGRTPAVALTAYSRVEDRVNAFGAGFQLHVAKPIDPRELVAIVATAAADRR